MFSIRDDGADLVRGHCSRFPRYQGWASHKVTGAGLAVALGAVLLIDGIDCQRTLGLGVLSLHNANDACGAADKCNSEPDHGIPFKAKSICSKNRSLDAGLYA